MDLSVRTGLDKIARDSRQGLSLYFNSTVQQEYILRYSRYEDVDALAERQNRTLLKVKNYVREINQKYIEGLYRRQDSIQRTSPNKDFQKFLDGWYDTWFRREVAPMALLLPEIYVMLVPTGGGAFRPAVVFPQYITNFELSPNMEILAVDMRMPDKRIMKIDGDSVQFYTGSLDKDSNLTWWPANNAETYHHGMGFCPIIRAAYEENVEVAVLEGTPTGHSFMYPVIMLATGDLQDRSMLSEAVHDHLTYQMIMGLKTATETFKSGLGSDMPIIESQDEHGTTRYLQKPSLEIEQLRKIVFEDNPKEIYETARLQSRFSSSAQTGAARAFDLWPENGVLTTIAGYFWDIDDRIVQMLARAMGVTAEVTYPTVFDTRTSSDTLRDGETYLRIMKDNPASESAVRETVNQLTHAVMPGISSEKLARFENETKGAPIPWLVEQKAKLAQIQNPPSEKGGDGGKKDGPGNGELPATGGDPKDAPASRKQLPPAGETEVGEGKGSGAPESKPDGGSSGNDTASEDRQGDGPDALRDGRDNVVHREVANGMEIALVANCEAGTDGNPSEEEEEYSQLIEGLEEAGYEVTFINLANSLDTLLSLDPDMMVWNAIEAFHDKAQFEMHCAAYMELAHFHFTGSPSKTLGLLQDKALAKTVLAGVGCAVKNAVLLRRGVTEPDMSHLTWPRMVKPAAEDASEGITAENVTHNDQEMRKVISRLYTITDSILVEEYAEGRELLVGVLGNGNERIVLPPMEIEFLGEAKIVTQDAKQNSDSKDFDEVVTKDAVLTPEEIEAIDEAVLTATRALGVQDYARVDIRLTPEGVPIIIEINPNPDLSPEHGYGGSAQLAGMTFPQLLDRIVKIAQKRYEPRGAQ